MEALKILKSLSYSWTAQDYKMYSCKYSQEEIGDAIEELKKFESKDNTEICNWLPEDWQDEHIYEDMVWQSSCGYSFVLDEGTPKDSEWEYCPKCGKKLEVKDAYPLDFDEWFKINEENLMIKFAETGADREMDFNLEAEIDKEYNEYLRRFKEESQIGVLDEA